MRFLKAIRLTVLGLTVVLQGCSSEPKNPTSGPLFEAKVSDLTQAIESANAWKKYVAACKKELRSVNKYACNVVPDWKGKSRENSAPGRCDTLIFRLVDIERDTENGETNPDNYGDALKFADYCGEDLDDFTAEAIERLKELKS